MEREALNLALEALRHASWDNDYEMFAGAEAERKLRQAIEQAERQETNHVTLTQTNVGIGERGMQAYEEAKKRGWEGVSDERLMEMPQQEQVEPVAKVVLTETLGLPCLQWLDLNRQFDFKGGEYLYTTPQQRKPLTEMQIIEATEHIDESRSGYFIHIARAIEAAHGIKE